MQELYDDRVRDEPHARPGNSPREIFASAQLAAREFFGPVGDVAHFPHSFVIVSSRRRRGRARARRRPAPASAPASRAGSEPAPAGVRDRDAGERRRGPARTSSSSARARPARSRPATSSSTARRCCASSRASRPDFLRVLRARARQPARPRGRADVRRAQRRQAQRHVQPEAPRRASTLVQRLIVEWADAVAENFAPRAMRGFGLDYDTLAAMKPDLVMVSACLNGQTGPHRTTPASAARARRSPASTALTGWPDREPVGPYGTITDSLAPRFVATALAAGLLLPAAHRARRVPRPRAGRGRRSTR